MSVSLGWHGALAASPAGEGEVERNCADETAFLEGPAEEAVAVVTAKAASAGVANCASL